MADEFGNSPILDPEAPCRQRADAHAEWVGRGFGEKINTSRRSAPPT